MGVLSSTQALLLLLFTTIIWGSWYQCIKRLNGWPVAAFMLWMYTFSVGIVWGIILVIKPFFIAEPLLKLFRGSRETAYLPCAAECFSVREFRLI